MSEKLTPEQWLERQRQAAAWDAFQYADRAWRKSIHGSEHDDNPAALRAAFEQYWTEKHGGGK